MGVGRGRAPSTLDLSAVRAVEANDFETGRGLMGYQTAFSARFSSDLLRLSGDDRWVDMGCGEGRALFEYRRLLPNPPWFSFSER